MRALHLEKKNPKTKQGITSYTKPKTTFSDVSQNYTYAVDHFYSNCVKDVLHIL